MVSIIFLILGFQSSSNLACLRHCCNRNYVHHQYIGDISGYETLGLESIRVLPFLLIDGCFFGELFKDSRWDGSPWYLA
jgi:hypothetical protein